MAHVRIISPSGPIDPVYIEGATRRLLSWGHTVSEGRFARSREGRFAASDEDRVADWLDACADDSVDIILCARGGYGLQRIIDRLPATDKLVIGFSDITELHCLQNGHHHPSLHAIMCKHLSTLPEDSEPIRLWQQAVAGQPLRYELPSHPLNREGEARGTLIGGNLSVLYGLQSTPFSLSSIMHHEPCIMHHSSCILFIEDIAERHYHIDRMMNNLRMSGVLASLGGLIVGQFSDCDEDPGMNETIYETIRRAVSDYDYPVVFDFPAGHVERNLPLRMGSEVSVVCHHDGVTVLN